MIQSELLGRHFWISSSGEFVSCPTFEDGTPDTDNLDYLEEWQGDDLTVLEFNEIVRIYQRLSSRRFTGVGGWDLPQKIRGFLCAD